MKIDFHTHILPGIDDGARSPDMAKTMLDKLSAQGVDTVVLTPHYYSHQKPIENFVEQQHEAYHLLRAMYTSSSPELILGAEVYFSDYLFNNRDLSMLCIENTRTMLLELPYNKTIDDRMLDKIDRLIGDYDIVPVIAHIERYPTLLRNPRLLESMQDMGCFLQINLPSLTSFGKRRLASFVKNGYIGAIGTDAHNLTSRPASYKEGYSFLEKSVSERVLKQLQRSMASLLHIKDEP